MPRRKPPPKRLKPKALPAKAEILPPMASGTGNFGPVNGMLAILRQRILDDADPVGFAIKVMNGEEFWDKIDGKKKKITPSLGMRIDVMKWLGDKILPSLKSVELTPGTPQDPNEDLLRMPESQRMAEIKRYLAVLGVESDGD